MNKAYRVIWLSVLTASFLCGGSIGINDVVRLSDTKDTKGNRLSDMIMDFREYDIRTQAERSNNIATIRVIVVGCVRCPGVYTARTQFRLKELLPQKTLITLSDHLAHSAITAIMLYRKGEAPRKLNLELPKDAETTLQDGDVLNIRALIL
jgi:hypothetical protein